VVGEVSGKVVAEVGDGTVVLESLLESTEGVDLSSIDHQIRQTGEYVETIIVSGPPSDLSAYTYPMSDNGYCSRGAYCKYSHGDDAVVPSQLMGMGGIPQAILPFMSMMNNAMFPGVNVMDGGNAYDPNERMDMQRTPMMRRQDVPVPTSGELPVVQDLTPWVPPEERVPQQNPDPQHPGPSNMVVDSVTPQDHAPPGQFGHHPFAQGQGHRGRRGRGGPRINGTFPSHAMPPDPFNVPPPDSKSQQPPRPDRRQDKTLVVEKIPEDRLSLGAVNDWFKQFGSVTNVAVDPPTAKALVTFAEHDQAWKAWKSEEAVFGNRFVKVYWHRPLEGRGGRGMKALEVSATLVGKLQNNEDLPPTQPATNGDARPVASTSTAPAPRRQPTTSTASVPRRGPTTSTSKQELAAKQERLQQMIGEQKALMSQLGTATAEEKKEIMAKLRKLGEDMKAPTPAPPVQKQEDVEMEKADQGAVKQDGGEGDGQEESTEALQAKLAKLKEEVIALSLRQSLVFVDGVGSCRQQVSVSQRRTNHTARTEGIIDRGVDEGEEEGVTSVPVEDLQGPV